MEDKSRLDFEVEEAGSTSHKAQLNPAKNKSPVPIDREGELRVRKALEEASAQNAELLHTLDETEVAVSRLHAQEARLESLEEEIQVQSSIVRTTEEDTQTHFKAHKRYQDSVGKKWYYILTKMRDKFQAKAKEEQDAYLQAVQRQVAAEKRQQELEQDLKTVQDERREVEPVARKHGEAHVLIDSLYESIFAGPTPGFPDEDAREATRVSREADYYSVTERLKDVKRSRQQLALFKAALARAESENERARDEIEHSLFSADNTFVWWQRCGRYIDQALGYAGEIYEILPTPMPAELAEAMETLRKTLQTVRSNTDEAVFSESYLPSRASMSQRVERIAEGIKAGSDNEAHFEKLLVAVEKSARLKIRQSARQLEDSRQALQEIRQGAFELVVGFGAAAPAYHECCDRAGLYETEAEQQCQRLPVLTIEELRDLPGPPSYDHVANTPTADVEPLASIEPDRSDQTPPAFRPKETLASSSAVSAAHPNVARVEV